MNRRGALLWRRLRRLAILVPAAGAATLAIHALAGAASVSLIAAHRGGAALRPENSLAAFRYAIALGVDALEFDLHLTRDGEVVVIHDPTVDRTTSGRGAVRDLTLAELRALRIKDRDGNPTDERVPTFAELLDLAMSTTVWLLPEIKVGTDRRPYPGVEEKVIAPLKAHGLLLRTTIQAFDADTIRRLKRREAGVQTMLLVSEAQIRRQNVAPAAMIAWARDLGATDIGMNYRSIDQKVMAAASAAGVRVAAWTVNEEDDIRRMLDLGVDIVMSDRPDLALTLAGR